MRVELDKQSLFALASDTRLDILKALQPMRRTVTQLAESLQIDKAAVHRHLKKLEDGGLVKRYEEHGFVYYGLSWKARDLMSPNENTKIIVMLSSTWLLVMVAAFLVLASLNSAQVYSEFRNVYGYEPAAGEMDFASNATGAQSYIPFPWIIYAAPAAGLAIVAITFGAIASRKTIRPRQRSPESAVEPSEPKQVED